MSRALRLAAVFASLFIIGTLALSAAGCAASSASTVLRVYNWEDYISQPDGESDEYVDLIAKFEEENPGVTVEYSTFGTNENMYNELKINAAGYDLVCPSDYMIMKMISEDMVEPFTDDFLANSNYTKYASPYIKDLFEENGWTRYAAAYMWGTMGYVYNPALVNAEDLSGWAGIWSNTYDHMTTIKDSVRDSYFLGVAYVYRDELKALTDEYDAAEMTLADERYAEYNAKVTEIMNRTDEDTLEKVKNALLDLKQYLYGFEVDSGKQDMITGKISINFAWSGDAVYSMDDAEPVFDEETGEQTASGIYLNYIVPEECSNIWFDGWVMPKGANVELAQKFIDFLSRPENAVANMNFIGYTSAIAGDEVYEEMIDWYDESAEGTPGFDEDGNALVAYDLNYFFGGTGEYENYVIYVSQDSLNRQISAQYPTEEVIVRSAVMQHFDNETNAAVNEMWEEVKGLPIPVWAYIVIAVIAALIIVAALSYLYKGKHRGHKPKKGYKILKRGA
ncbi:MAG TPA: extracellular solute-binding protein [Candidatus Borkfalkia avistercoris]|uniref:Extracellular solute-binding protein n=1 Tax=Candidatus Borkfalkia avistercoris TaxID=2838504 RepID=A0A9D2IED3_9FIRM|nr:extracellular solute-binding protein [Candidatus Borkfalkia avistercoris]